MGSLGPLLGRTAPGAPVFQKQVPLVCQKHVGQGSSSLSFPGIFEGNVAPLLNGGWELLRRGGGQKALSDGDSGSDTQVLPSGFLSLTPSKPNAEMQTFTAEKGLLMKQLSPGIL